MAMTLVSTVTLSSNSPGIAWTNIPQTGKDLVILFSARGDSTGTIARLTLNDDQTDANYSVRRLESLGSSVSSSSSSIRLAGTTATNTSAASTFSNVLITIPNYTSNNSKVYSEDGVNEDNATAATQLLLAGRWSGTSPITSIVIERSSGNFLTNTSASLYIIS